MTDWRLTTDCDQPRQDRWQRLPMPQTSRQSGLTGPERYIAHEALIEAVNTALALGQPLLVTGEPGCGKTELADFVAWKLGLDGAIGLDARTDMHASDLFYTFDALGRLYATQAVAHDPTVKIDPVLFIHYHGLGAAIIRASTPGVYAHLLPADFSHTRQRRSVVLIDEIDKAPRDVPNNLLRVMERPAFTIPELGHVTICADDAYRPILILTSNSEKALPDAFLRRCVYYHMPFPEPATLREIVANRITGWPADGGLVSDAIALLGHLRGRRRLRKPPGTAELLAFLLSLRGNGYAPGTRLNRDTHWHRWAVLNLLKTREDQEQAEAHLDDIAWPP